MILKNIDFVAKKINWNDKASNIIEILRDLNLNAESAVFLDDNPTERQRIRQAIPDILVPELTEDVSEWVRILNSLDCFETLNTKKFFFSENRDYLRRFP